MKMNGKWMALSDSASMPETAMGALLRKPTI